MYRQEMVCTIYTDEVLWSKVELLSFWLVVSNFLTGESASRVITLGLSAISG